MKQVNEEAYKQLNVATKLARKAMTNEETRWGLLCAVLIKNSYISSALKLTTKEDFVQQIKANFFCPEKTAKKLIQGGIRSGLVKLQGRCLVAKSLLKGYIHRRTNTINGQESVYHQVDHIQLEKIKPHPGMVKEMLNQIRKMLIIHAVRQATVKVSTETYSSLSMGNKPYSTQLTEMNESQHAHLSRKFLSKITGLSKSGVAKVMDKMVYEGIVRKYTYGVEFVCKFVEGMKLGKGMFIVRNKKTKQLTVCQRQSCGYIINETFDKLYTTGSLIVDHIKRSVFTTAQYATEFVRRTGLDPSSPRFTMRDAVRCGYATSIYDC